MQSSGVPVRWGALTWLDVTVVQLFRSYGNKKCWLMFHLSRNLEHGRENGHHIGH